MGKKSGFGPIGRRRHPKRRSPLSRLLQCRLTAPLVLAPALLALLALTGACGTLSEEPIDLATSESETTMSNESKRAIPENAIPAGDELYMIPLGKDGDGCEQFSPFSPTKMVATVIYYRDKNGGFTTDKRKADCG